VRPLLRWSDDADRILDDCNVGRLTPQEPTQRHVEFDRAETQARQLRERAGPARP
jgi:hypothetical protein